MGLERLCEVNLAGEWRFEPEGGKSTVIQLPGGGWLKQGFDCEAGTYERRITIPDSGQPQTVRLELGAVNHLAEVFIGRNEDTLAKIHKEVTAFTPQQVDLTPYVEPGGDYLLRIFVRAYEDGHPIAPHWAEWCECIARGIFRDAYLRAYPSVFLSDTFVRTSVTDAALTAKVWITSTASEDQTVVLYGQISSWNGENWPYPTIPEMSICVPSRSTVQVTLGPLDWAAGADSYWWPNVPYCAGRLSQLHILKLVLGSGGDETHSATVRFGFREIRQVGDHYELNGVRINFRGDNLQVANYDRVECGGRGDAIDTLPGFLPPSRDNPGWPRAVDNFLRLNYNVQRQHMGPWSPYMIDVCDEMGLMLIGESASRWNGFDMEDGRGFHEIKCLQDIVRRDRNHPSIIRWSAKNEPQCTEPDYHVELYDAIKASDDTRPISEDIVVFDRQAFNVGEVFAGLLDANDFTWIEHYLTYDDNGRPFFTNLEHNDAVILLKDRPFGLGEADWMRSSTPAGLTWFATTIALARAQGASDVRPYVLLSSWVSSVPGVRSFDLSTEENRHPVYGEDNLADPWGHPGIKLLQTACHPLLALDVAFWHDNRRSDGWGHFPVVAPRLKANSSVTREVTVFNDELEGADVELHWDVREGSTSNRPYEGGHVPLALEPGRMAMIPVTFGTPVYNTFVFLTLRVIKGGVDRFCDELTCFEIAEGKDFAP